MIRDDCFEKDWIDGFRKQKRFGKINSPLVEKMIQALYLVQNLKKQKLNFVFKDGTSLILPLENANRFSVDIDIVLKKPPKSSRGGIKTPSSLLQDRISPNLQRGIKSLDPFLISGYFRLDDVISPSAKAACLAAKMLTRSHDILKRCDGADVPDLNIEDR